jgi:hypothetical protein
MIERTTIANEHFRSRVLDDFLKADETLRERLYEFAGEGAVANYIQLEFVFPSNTFDDQGGYIDRVAEDRIRWDVV